MSDYKHVLFDLETAPSEELRANVTASFIEDHPDLMAPSESWVKTQTEADIKEFISNANPDEAWLAGAIASEIQGKNRKGVAKVLADRIDVLADPLPGKWQAIPELQEIITLGYSKGCDGVVTVRQYDEVEDNYDDWIVNTLEEYWELAAERPVCGWNITGFDLPVIILQSTRYNVRMRRQYNIHSFTGKETHYLDLMKARFGRDWRKLRQSALAVGMPFSVDQEDGLSSGANVADAFLDGRYHEILEHCRIDIIRLQYLYRAYQGLFFV